MRRSAAYILVLMVLTLAPKSDSGAAVAIGLALVIGVWAGWRTVGSALGWRVTYLAGGAVIGIGLATAQILGSASWKLMQLGFVLEAVSILVPMLLPYLRYLQMRLRQRRSYGAPVRRYVPKATHMKTLMVASTLAVLHGLDAAFWHSDPVGPLLLAVIAGAAIAVLVSYPRLGRNARSAATGVLGLVATMRSTREHVVPFLTGNVEPIDYSGLGLFAAALLLIYIADRNASGTWRTTRKRDPIPHS
jgi:hypothetical protein